MRRFVALVIALLVCFSGSVCLAGNVNFSGGWVDSPSKLIDGLTVGASSDLQPGWYRAVPASGEHSKLTIVDVVSFDEPVIVASYAWWPEGVSLLADRDDEPEEYVFPLWDGCFVLSGFVGGLEYDADSGELLWDGVTEAPAIDLVFVAPLGESEGSVPAASMPDEGSALLYEDARIAIRYSDFYVVTHGDDSYLKIKWLIENKTSEIIDVTCMSITVNGCAVHISKYVDVPPACQYLHEWTSSADLYLQYGIEDVESFSAVITIDNGRDIVTNEIQVE